MLTEQYIQFINSSAFGQNLATQPVVRNSTIPIVLSLAGTFSSKTVNATNYQKSCTSIIAQTGFLTGRKKLMQVIVDCNDDRYNDPKIMTDALSLLFNYEFATQNEMQRLVKDLDVIQQLLQVTLNYHNIGKASAYNIAQIESKFGKSDPEICNISKYIETMFSNPHSSMKKSLAALNILLAQCVGVNQVLVVLQLIKSTAIAHNEFHPKFMHPDIRNMMKSTLASTQKYHSEQTFLNHMLLLDKEAQDHMHCDIIYPNIWFIQYKILPAYVSKHYEVYIQAITDFGLNVSPTFTEQRVNNDVAKIELIAGQQNTLVHKNNSLLLMVLNQKHNPTQDIAITEKLILQLGYVRRNNISVKSATAFINDLYVPKILGVEYDMSEFIKPNKAQMYYMLTQAFKPEMLSKKVSVNFCVNAKQFIFEICTTLKSQITHESDMIKLKVSELYDAFHNSLIKSDKEGIKLNTDISTNDSEYTEQMRTLDGSFFGMNSDTTTVNTAEVMKQAEAWDSIKNEDVRLQSQVNRRNTRGRGGRSNINDAYRPEPDPFNNDHLGIDNRQGDFRQPRQQFPTQHEKINQVIREETRQPFSNKTSRPLRSNNQEHETFNRNSQQYDNNGQAPYKNRQNKGHKQEQHQSNRADAQYNNQGSNPGVPQFAQQRAPGNGIAYSGANKNIKKVITEMYHAELVPAEDTEHVEVQEPFDFYGVAQSDGPNKIIDDSIIPQSWDQALFKQILTDNLNPSKRYKPTFTVPTDEQFMAKEGVDPQTPLDDYLSTGNGVQRLDTRIEIIENKTQTKLGTTIAGPPLNVNIQYHEGIVRFRDLDFKFEESQNQLLWQQLDSDAQRKTQTTKVLNSVTEVKTTNTVNQDMYKGDAQPKQTIFSGESVNSLPQALLLFKFRQDQICVNNSLAQHFDHKTIRGLKSMTIACPLTQLEAIQSLAAYIASYNLTMFCHVVQIMTVIFSTYNAAAAEQILMSHIFPKIDFSNGVNFQYLAQCVNTINTSGSHILYHCNDEGDGKYHAEFNNIKRNDYRNLLAHNLKAQNFAKDQEGILTRNKDYFAQIKQIMEECNIILIPNTRWNDEQIIFNKRSTMASYLLKEKMTRWQDFYNQLVNATTDTSFDVVTRQYIKTHIATLKHTMKETQSILPSKNNLLVNEHYLLQSQRRVDLLEFQQCINDQLHSTGLQTIVFYNPCHSREKVFIDLLSNDYTVIIYLQSYSEKDNANIRCWMDHNPGFGQLNICLNKENITDAVKGIEYALAMFDQSYYLNDAFFNDCTAQIIIDKTNTYADLTFNTQWIQLCSSQKMQRIGDSVHIQYKGAMETYVHKASHSDIYSQFNINNSQDGFIISELYTYLNCRIHLWTKQVAQQAIVPKHVLKSLQVSTAVSYQVPTSSVSQAGSTIHIKLEDATQEVLLVIGQQLTTIKYYHYLILSQVEDMSNYIIDNLLFKGEFKTEFLFNMRSHQLMSAPSDNVYVMDGFPYIPAQGDTILRVEQESGEDRQIVVKSQAILTWILNEAFICNADIHVFKQNNNYNYINIKCKESLNIFSAFSQSFLMMSIVKPQIQFNCSIKQLALTPSMSINQQEIKQRFPLKVLMLKYTETYSTNYYDLVPQQMTYNAQQNNIQFQQTILNAQVHTCSIARTNQCVQIISRDLTQDNQVFRTRQIWLVKKEDQRMKTFSIRSSDSTIKMIQDVLSTIKHIMHQLLSFARDSIPMLQQLMAQIRRNCVGSVSEIILEIKQGIIIGFDMLALYLKHQAQEICQDVTTFVGNFINQVKKIFGQASQFIINYIRGKYPSFNDIIIENAHSNYFQEVIVFTDIIEDYHGITDQKDLIQLSDDELIEQLIISQCQQDQITPLNIIYKQTDDKAFIIQMANLSENFNSYEQCLSGSFDINEPSHVINHKITRLINDASKYLNTYNLTIFGGVIRRAIVQDNFFAHALAISCGIILEDKFSQMFNSCEGSNYQNIDYVFIKNVMLIKSIFMSDNKSVIVKQQGTKLFITDIIRTIQGINLFKGMQVTYNGMVTKYNKQWTIDILPHVNQNQVHAQKENFTKLTQKLNEVKNLTYKYSTAQQKEQILIKNSEFKDLNNSEKQFRKNFANATIINSIVPSYPDAIYVKGQKVGEIDQIVQNESINSFNQNDDDCQQFNSSPQDNRSSVSTDEFVFEFPQNESYEMSTHKDIIDELTNENQNVGMKFQAQIDTKLVMSKYSDIHEQLQTIMTSVLELSTPTVILLLSLSGQYQVNKMKHQRIKQFILTDQIKIDQVQIIKTFNALTSFKPEPYHTFNLSYDKIEQQQYAKYVPITIDSPFQWTVNYNVSIETVLTWLKMHIKRRNINEECVIALDIEEDMMSQRCITIQLAAKNQIYIMCLPTLSDVITLNQWFYGNKHNCQVLVFDQTMERRYFPCMESIDLQAELKNQDRVPFNATYYSLKETAMRLGNKIGYLCNKTLIESNNKQDMYNDKYYQAQDVALLLCIFKYMYTLNSTQHKHEIVTQQDLIMASSSKFLRQMSTALQDKGSIGNSMSDQISLNQGKFHMQCSSKQYAAQTFTFNQLLNLINKQNKRQTKPIRFSQIINCGSGASGFNCVEVCLSMYGMIKSTFIDMDMDNIEPDLKQADGHYLSEKFTDSNRAIITQEYDKQILLLKAKSESPSENLLIQKFKMQFATAHIKAPVATYGMGVNLSSYEPILQQLGQCIEIWPTSYGKPLYKGCPDAISAAMLGKRQPDYILITHHGHAYTLDVSISQHHNLKGVFPATDCPALTCTWQHGTHIMADSIFNGDVHKQNKEQMIDTIKQFNKHSTGKHQLLTSNECPTCCDIKSDMMNDLAIDDIQRDIMKQNNQDSMCRILMQNISAYKEGFHSYNHMFVSTYNSLQGSSLNAQKKYDSVDFGASPQSSKMNTITVLNTRPETRTLINDIKSASTSSAITDQDICANPKHSQLNDPACNEFCSKVKVPYISLSCDNDYEITKYSSCKITKLSQPLLKGLAEKCVIKQNPIGSIYMKDVKTTYHNQCRHNVLSCLFSRNQNGGKYHCQYYLDNYYERARVIISKMIKKNLSEDDEYIQFVEILQSSSNEQIADLAIQYIMQSDKPQFEKMKTCEDITKWAESGKLQNNIILSTKSEYLPNTSKPRPIRYTNNVRRAIQGALFKFISKSIDKLPFLIKGQSPSQRNQHVIDRLKNARYIIETDVTTFDLAQTDRYISSDYDTLLEIAPNLKHWLVDPCGDDHLLTIGDGSYAQCHTSRYSGLFPTAHFNSTTQAQTWLALQLYVNDKYGHGFTETQIVNWLMLSSIVEGDDGLIYCPNKTFMQQVINEGASVTGFNLKSYGSELGLNGLTLCKLTFFAYNNDNKFFACKKPFDVLKKVGVCKKNYGTVLSKTQSNIINQQIQSACAECYGTSLHRYLIQLLPPSLRNFTYDECKKMYEDTQGYQYKINTLHQYTEEEVEVYDSVYGYQLSELHAATAEHINSQLNLGFPFEVARIMGIETARYPLLFDNIHAKSIIPKNTQVEDFKPCFKSVKIQGTFGANFNTQVTRQQLIPKDQLPQAYENIYIHPIKINEQIKERPSLSQFKRKDTSQSLKPLYNIINKIEKQEQNVMEEINDIALLTQIQTLLYDELSDSELAEKIQALIINHPLSITRNLENSDSNFMLVDSGNQKRIRAYIVRNKFTEDTARQFLGPLACIGSLVWVHVQYAKDMKMKYGKGEEFKKWIAQFTAHNSKLGYNSKALERVFAKVATEVKLPASSKYPTFLKVANALKLQGDNLIKPNYQMVQQDQLYNRRPLPQQALEYARSLGAQVPAFRNEASFDHHYNQYQPEVYGGESSNIVEYALRDAERGLNKISDNPIVMNIYDNQAMEPHLKHRITSMLTKETSDSLKMADQMKRNVQRSLGDKTISDHKTVQHVVEVLSKLKDVTKSTENEDEKKYMYMHVAPWSSGAVREPDYSGQQTYAWVERKSLIFTINKTIGLAVINLAAASIGAMGVTQTNDATFHTTLPVISNVVGDQGNYQKITYTKSDLVTTAFQLPLSDGSTKTDTKGLITQAKLVGGAVRLSKVSKSDTETGVIHAAYVSAQITGNLTIKDVFESKDNQHSSYMKVYPAQAQDTQLKTGTLIEFRYRPDNQDDVGTFYDINQSLYLMDRDKHMPFGNQFGEPIAQQPDNRFVGPIEFESAVVGQSSNIFQSSVFAPKSLVLLFENVQAGQGNTGMTFELEYIRFLEGIPQNDQNFLEIYDAQLVNYSTPLELLRRQQITSQYFNNFEMQAGINIWKLPMLQTALDLITKGLDKLNINFDVKQAISQALPQAARILVNRLVGDEKLADIAQQLVKNVTTDDNIGSALNQLINQDNSSTNQIMS